MTDFSPVSIPIIPSIASAAAGKAAWLVDIWGVIHNGVVPFPDAVAACERFRDTGGVVLLLSNAPRPAPSVASQLDRIGVRRSAWDMIISSGDASRAMIATFAPGPVHHLGPERDVPLYDGLGVELGDIDTAKAIVCTGLFDDEHETPDTYHGLLTLAATRKVPMICANPDLTVERGNKIIPCAGAVAAHFEKLGGTVRYAGKPYRPVYDMAFKALSDRLGRAIGPDDVLAIGDGIKTDIQGAANVGIRSVYIASGVALGHHGELNAATLLKIFPKEAPQPSAAMARLAWSIGA
jgi:HAD superfamily hydrolase (TIGR01459 family)